MSRVVCHAAIDEKPGPFVTPFDRADTIDSNSSPCDQTTPGFEMQTREIESALPAAFDDCLSNSAHITFDGGTRQLLFVIRYAPSAAGTEMPFAAEANLLCQVQRHVDRGN